VVLLSIEPDGPVPIYQQIRDRIVEANKGYDLLRQEGLLRLGRKSGAVVRRDASSGSPDPAWARDWTERLQTLLAEAAAQGMPATSIVGECEAALADFAFPAAAGKEWQGSGSPP
jgi:DNA-binding transcriptional regulator YhcF (GntR family)